MLTEALSISVKRNAPHSPSIVRGKGCFLYDELGRGFLDMSGGSGAANLGYQREDLIEVIKSQSEKLIHTGWNIDNPLRHKMLEKLYPLLPFPDASVMAAVTGAEAIEVALKIARAYSGRRDVLYFSNSFHGKTQGALAVTSNTDFRRHLASGNSDDLALELEYESSSEHVHQWRARLAEVLTQRKVQGTLPAAIIVEPIQAAEGMYPVPKSVLQAILELGKQFDIVTIFDEIYTGFGRTGTPFVSDVSLLPDLIVLGKALGNGLPISAVAGRAELVDVLSYAAHSSTFTLMPLACAVSCKVLDIYHAEQPWRMAADNGQVLHEAILTLAQSEPRISKVRGRGMMLAFDFAGDRAHGQDVVALRESLLERGVIVRTGGSSGSTVKLTPPLIIDPVQIAEFVSTLHDACQSL